MRMETQPVRPSNLTEFLTTWVKLLHGKQPGVIWIFSEKIKMENPIKRKRQMITMSGFAIL